MMSQVYTPDQKIPGFTLLVLTGKSVVSIQVVLTQTQTVKLHTNLVHPNYSFCVNKENILGECSLFFTPKM